MTTDEPVRVDYDAYLSAEAKGRARSQLKALRPYFDMPGMISFGGGYPHPSTWPVNGMTLSVPFAGKSVFVPGYETRTPDQLLPLADYDEPGKDELQPDLARELQYGKTFGAEYFVRFLTEHVRRVHAPPNDGWQVLSTAGNTDTIDGLLRTLFERGDSLLTEEFAYPGVLQGAKSQGIACVGVPMDQDGPLAGAMDEILSQWDEQARGSRKPRVIIMVPTCSNPTGYTMPEARKHEIYAVARAHGLLIIEDDPYCFLQMRPKGADLPITPSFLSLDVDGRVLRADSFSKIVAPGSRCGWLTGPKEIVTRVMNRSESSTQCPSGFSVSAIAAVLRAWGGHEGFEQRYLPHISKIYEERCLTIIRAFEAHLPRAACEWPEGQGGMFIWLRLKCETHPELESMSAEEISDRVFKACIEEKVLLAPSLYFKAPGQTWTRDEEARRIFMRVCYATPTAEEIDEGVKRLATALRREWRLE